MGLKLSPAMAHRLGIKGIAPKHRPAGTPHVSRIEADWFLVLRSRHPGAFITRQFRVRINQWNAPVAVHYTADLALFFRHDGHLEDWWKTVLWEVKDRRRRPHSDELTRPKMVRANNPWISAVFLAIWDGQVWEERLLA
jgi:hypothetical protein